MAILAALLGVFGGVLVGWIVPDTFRHMSRGEFDDAALRLVWSATAIVICVPIIVSLDSIHWLIAATSATLSLLFSSVAERLVS